MEDIVSVIKTGEPITDNEYCKLISDAGFVRKVAGFPRITEDSIVNYLKTMSDKRASGVSKRIKPINMWTEKGDDFVRVHSSYQYGLFYTTVLRLIAEWRETDISKYFGVPPKHVLKSVINSRDRFDVMRVVTVRVEEEKIDDPLLIGRIYNDEIRYLVDYWDKDFQDLPTLVKI